ncbi:hypothetical protein [Streptomyces syringium]|uniref:hypothetical protein n=1 Tax=Streptomyces syringium TaxID=76729 RepID=UPI003AAEA75D
MRNMDSETGAVEFTSPLGNAWGIWMGTQRPDPGTYHVEFEIPEQVDSWVPSEVPAGRIEGEQQGHTQQVSVSGIVENVDDDFMVTLRVGTDVILVEMAPSAPAVHKGEPITFSAATLELYPYQL